MGRLPVVVVVRNAPAGFSVEEGNTSENPTGGCEKRDSDRSRGVPSVSRVSEEEKEGYEKGDERVGSLIVTVNRERNLLHSSFYLPFQRRRSNSVGSKDKRNHKGEREREREREKESRKRGKGESSCPYAPEDKILISSNSGAFFFWN